MWYDGLFVNQSNFAVLSSRFTSLIRELVGDQPFSVHVAKNHPAPASVDLDTRIITIDKEFFSGNHEIYANLSWNERLEFCAGVCVHEGAHIAYTPKNWITYHLPKGKMPRTPVAFATANVVEDIFIEGHAKLTNSNFAYIIDFVDNVMFTDDEIAKRRELWTGEKPETEEDLYNALNYMITWKRRNFGWFFQTDFERTLYKLFISADGAANPVTRGKITQEILKLLLGKEKCEEQAKEIGNENGKGKGFDVNRPFAMKPDGEMVNVPAHAKASEILRTDFALTEEKGNSTDGYFFLNVKPLDGYRKIEEINFTGFNRLIQARNSQRALKGQPTTRGQKIRNLSHYNEGKIFGEMKIEGERVGRGKQDIVILVDLSGSMNGNVSGQLKKKITFALECAGGLARTFEKEGFNYSILGHTESWVPEEMRCSSREYYGNVVMYKFKGLNEKKNVKDVVVGLEWMNQVFRGGGNNDSYAIFLAAQEFTQQNDKILIVISDGEPTEYSTSKLVKHGINCPGNPVGDTKAVVDFLRRTKGVNVFSLAIDSVAVSGCKKIYGENFTATAFNPQDFVNAVIKFTE